MANLTKRGGLLQAAAIKPGSPFYRGGIGRMVRGAVGRWAAASRNIFGSGRMMAPRVLGAGKATPIRADDAQGRAPARVAKHGS